MKTTQIDQVGDGTSQQPTRESRRRWLASAGIVGAAALLSVRPGWGQEKKLVEEEEIAPPEDLMREHGVLNRVLLVYDEAIRRIDAKQDVPPNSLRDAASIVRTFIEDYHEKLEEDFLFPRFEKAGERGLGASGRDSTQIRLGGLGIGGAVVRHVKLRESSNDSIVRRAR